MDMEGTAVMEDMLRGRRIRELYDLHVTRYMGSSFTQLCCNWRTELGFCGV